MNLGDIAAHLGGVLHGNPRHTVTGVTSIPSSHVDTLTFVLTPSVEKTNDLSGITSAVTFRLIDAIPNQIVVTNPRKAMAQSIALFHGPAPDSGISPLAHCHPSAIIGAHTLIHPGVVIGEHVTIGTRCIIHPNVTIYPHSIIGSGVIIHAGSVIGSDGFGYYFDDGAWGKIPHVGRVIIGDNVEIGANCTIDRGVLDDTLIGTGTKIDNLCHIAHNTHIGSHCAIAGQSGTTGRAKIGDGVQVGGQAGIADVSIGNFSVIAGRAGVTHDIDAKSFVSGFPAWNHRHELKKEAWIRHQFSKRKDSK